MRNNCFIHRQRIVNTVVLSFLVRRISFLFLFCFLFLVKNSFCQITEGFEEGTTSATTGGTGMPTGYSTGSYVLSSGIWVFANAMKGSTGYHGGTGSCTLKSATGSSIISPAILTDGVGTITFWASVGTDGTSLQVLISTDGGLNFTQLGSSYSLTTTPKQYSAIVNNSNANIQIKFKRTLSTVYLDDIYIAIFPVIKPTITLTGTLAAVNTIYGTASAIPTSFSVTGNTMNAGILVTAPAGYEVSGNATSNYANSITVGSSGTIAATNVYVRLSKTTTAGNYSGNIILSSSGATTINEPTASSTVALFPLTVSGILAINKIYDGTTTVSLTGYPVLSNTVNNDVINITGTATGLFATNAVANGKLVSISGLTLLGTNSASYTISAATTVADITALALTINNAAASNKMYDGNTVASLSGTLNAVILNDVSNVVLIATGNFSQSMVADNLTVISYSTLTGSASGNYNLIQPVGLTANISKANQTINFSTITTPVTTTTKSVTLTATASSGLPVIFTSSNNAIASIAGTIVTIKSIGAAIITASQPGDTNHFAAVDITQNLVVNSAPVVIYQHSFESGSFGGTVYTQPPAVLSSFLTNTSWSISKGVLQNYPGSGGNGSGALGVLAAASASPFSLSVDVLNGYSLSINSFSFWRYTSSSVIWTLLVNGITIGSGSSPTGTGSPTGTFNVTNPINGLTGTVSIQLILSGTGSFRLDDFTLNGNLISCGILPSISVQPLTQNICSAAPLNLNVTATNVNTYQWRKEGINIAGATGNSYTVSSAAFLNSGTYDVLLTGSTYCTTTFSNKAVIVVNQSPSGIFAAASVSAVCNGTPVSLRSTYSGVSENFETFPLTSFSVSGARATMIQNDSFYQQGTSSVLFNTDSSLVTNPAMTMIRDIDLTKYGNSPLLQFNHICALEGVPSPYDFGFVEYSTDGGSVWTTFPTNTYMGSGTLFGSTGICFNSKSYNDWSAVFTTTTSTPGSSPATGLWKHETIDLSSFVCNSSFRIRFRITTDVSNIYYGWLIDNFIIGSIPTEFRWSSIPSGYSANTQNPFIQVSPCTTSNYIVTATNSYGCTTTGNTLITVNPSPNTGINYLNSPICKTAGNQSVNILGFSDIPLITETYSAPEGLALNGLTGVITPSSSTMGTYLVAYYFEGTNGCISKGTTSVEINKAGLWKTAGFDSNWTNTNNWACTSLPGYMDNLVISSASTYYPVIDGLQSIHDMNIGSGASLTVTGKLNITGSVFNTGKLNATTGTIEFNGDTPQNILGGLSVKNLIIDNSNGVYLGNTSSDTVSVTGIYTPVSGILNTGGNLLLVSDQQGTASVANGGDHYITGNVTVQRYHNDKRAWILITAPLSTAGMTNSIAGDIYSNWQANTYITGPDTSNGLDKGTNSTYGMLYWTGAKWGNINNTKNAYSLFGKVAATNDSMYNKPFFLFVRGNRSITPSLGGHSSVSLHATGSIQTGDLPATIIGSTGLYGLVANPYAAPVDLNVFRTDNSGLINTYYYWDPGLSATGGYVTASYLANKWYYTNQTIYNSSPHFIQSGQAFFLTSNGKKTVLFKESQKNTDSTRNAVFEYDSVAGSVRVELSKGSSQVLIDGVLGLYNNNFVKAVFQGEDAVKFWGNEENIAIISSGSYLSLEARPDIYKTDTMFLYMNNMIVGTTYHFTITENNMPSTVTGFLIDNFLCTKTQLNFPSASNITFIVSSVDGSNASNRFIIVYNNTGNLGVLPIQMRATDKDKCTRIDWTLADEKGIDYYELERSYDATTYQHIFSVKASKSNETNSYCYFDKSSDPGYSYYRIKALIEDGRLQQYSNVEKVWRATNNNAISTFPNPVTEKNFNIILNNVIAGNYTINLYNAIGKPIVQQYINHKRGNAIINISLPANLSVGIYQLKITGLVKDYVEMILVK